ncbi:MAG: DegT/DnrJ/EryC1/StrS family aminotransferase, partial [Planctomycetota bacterium]
GRFTGGPTVESLEKALAERVGVPHAVGVSSGTDALLCTLMAMGIGPGDEVIVPTFTFFATAGSVARLGAVPVFVDVDPRTFNLDPEAVSAAVTSKTKAVIVVHLFGQCADMDAIDSIAREHGLRVIEDAAQAIDARYQDRPACSLGDAACLSFYPTKNLGGFGEGGMVFTRDDELAEAVRSLRTHGESKRYVHERIGGNFRLDAIQAAALRVKLDYLEEFTERRRRNAARYDALLADAPVTTPHVADGVRHVYHQYTILCDRRDELAAFLRERGVRTGVYYPVPLHRQPCFADGIGRARPCPTAESLCRRVLSLPCHPILTEEDVAYVAETIRAFFASATAARAKGGSVRVEP